MTDLLVLIRNVRDVAPSHADEVTLCKALEEAIETLRFYAENDFGEYIIDWTEKEPGAKARAFLEKWL